MPASAPLKLIFVTQEDESAHVAFYDLFGGLVEVAPAGFGGQAELVISPINKYLQAPHEIITLWITPQEKEAIGQAIQEMFDKHDLLGTIFKGGLVDNSNDSLTATSFCVKALRAAVPVLPDIPVNCITVQKLYTVLKLMGGM